MSELESVRVRLCQGNRVSESESVKSNRVSETENVNFRKEMYYNNKYTCTLSVYQFIDSEQWSESQSVRVIENQSQEAVRVRKCQNHSV